MLVFFNFIWVWVSYVIDFFEIRKLSWISFNKLVSEELEVVGVLVGYDKYKGIGWILMYSVNE